MAKSSPNLNEPKTLLKGAVTKLRDQNPKLMDINQAILKRKTANLAASTKNTYNC